VITSLKNSIIRLLPIFKNTSSTVVIRGLFGVARILVLLLVARQFAPEEFGRLSLILSITEIFKVFADFGLDTITIRRYSMERHSTENVLNTVLSMKLICATIAYAAAMVFFWFAYGSIDGLQLLFLIALTIYTTLIINAFVSYFQANLNVSRVITSNVISVVVYIALTILFLKLKYPLVAFAAIIPASELLNMVLTAQVYARITQIRLSLDWRVAKKLFRESAPVGIAGLIVVLYLRLDNMMIGWFLGEKSIGEYAAAYRITEPFFLVFSSLSVSLYAYFSAASGETSLSMIKNKLRKIIMVLFMVSAAIALILFLFAHAITGLLPAKYETSAGVLMILCWSIIFRAINPQLTAFINARGKFTMISVVAAGNLIANIILNLILIPKYGIKGAAGAVVATELLNSVFQLSCIAFVLRGPQRSIPDAS
jgi:O-antigen/teichoic acid export membrane protein